MSKNKYESQYQKILKECIIKGTYRDDRTGIGSYSLFRPEENQVH